MNVFWLVSNFNGLDDNPDTDVGSKGISGDIFAGFDGGGR